MTKSERVMCALGGEQPDRVPIYDLISNFALLSHFAGTPVNVDNAHELLPLAASRMLDTTRVWLPGELGRRVDGRGFVHERTAPFNEWVVERPFSSPEEIVRYVEADIEECEGWRPPGDEQRKAELEGQLRWKAAYGDTVIPAGSAGEALSHAFITLGLEAFVHLETDRKQLVQRWLEAAHERTMRRIEGVQACGAISSLAWLFDDIALKGRLMFSPDFLRSHGVFRHISEICDIFHSFGWKIIFHSDGNFSQVIPDLLDAGVDALAPLEISAGMDLRSLKDAYGARTCFVGGVDLKVLRFGTPDDVRRLVRETLAIMCPGGGFILGSDAEELDNDLPLENVLAMCETTLEYGK